jgi:cytosine permease
VIAQGRACINNRGSRMAGSTQHHSKLEDAEEQVDHLLGNEYEHEPVPASARRSLFSVTLVWAGFPMIITGAMTGSILVLGMGFTHALTAMIIGNHHAGLCWGIGAARHTGRR